MPVSWELTPLNYIILARNIRNEVSVVVVVKRVDTISSVITEIAQRLRWVAGVNGDSITVNPYLNADQHNVDV